MTHLPRQLSSFRKCFNFHESFTTVLVTIDQNISVGLRSGFITAENKRLDEKKVPCRQ